MFKGACPFRKNADHEESESKSKHCRRDDRVLFSNDRWPSGDLTASHCCDSLPLAIDGMQSHAGLGSEEPYPHGVCKTLENRDMTHDKMTRRSALGAIAAGAAGTQLYMGTLGATLGSASEGTEMKLKGNIKQSVSRWCYGKIELDDLAKECAKMGLVGIDLLSPEEWPVVQKHGLVPTMGMPGGGSINDGLNDKANHAEARETLTKNVALAAKMKVPNIICFSGRRRDKSDEEAWETCTVFLKEAVKQAEDLGVTICMELLNSKVDHKDYHCDHTPWGVELCKRVDSPRFKLLYDIYHMQIMEGDVIRTIRDYHEYIGHYHTGGVPGRNEIDDTQELYYPAIMKAIVETGYDGYVAHEFVPKRDPLTSLAEAIQICDV